MANSTPCEFDMDALLDWLDEEGEQFICADLILRLAKDRVVDTGWFLERLVDPELLHDVTLSGDKTLLYRIAYNKCAAHKTLLYLATHDNEDVRERVAHRAPASLQTLLVSDPSAHVRRALAGNTLLSADVQEVLVTCLDRKTAWAIVWNTGATEDSLRAVHAFACAGGPFDNYDMRAVRSSIAEHRACSAEFERQMDEELDELWVEIRKEST